MSFLHLGKKIFPDSGHDFFSSCKKTKKIGACGAIFFKFWRLRRHILRFLAPAAPCFPLFFHFLAPEAPYFALFRRLRRIYSHSGAAGGVIFGAG